jgi:uncharacterized protein with PIN domain
MVTCTHKVARTAESDAARLARGEPLRRCPVCQRRYWEDELDPKHGAE